MSTPDKKGQSPVLKNLLQNYGFDLVKQFNEMQKKNENGKDERKKFTCPICAQHFNSVWLLKGHSEDEHKDLLSQDIIDRYIESCKRESEETNEQKERSSLPKSHDECPIAANEPSSNANGSASRP